MNGRYYIGKKRKRSRKRRLWGLILFLLLPALLLHFCLYPQVLALVEGRVNTRLSSLAARQIALTLSETDTSYTSLIHIDYGTDGAVRAVSVDTVKVALLKQRLALSLLDALEAEGTLSVSVPIGNLFGFLPLSGLGKPLTVRVKTADSLKASFHSSFTEAGINQTRHTIRFCFEITVYCLISGRVETITLSSSFPAAETVIVGDVPDSLTQISRLTDGVTEFDIDDAVDFGNVVG